MTATEPLVVDGRVLRAAVVNENQARVAAGLTLALGAVAFDYANFDKLFWPIRTVSTFFFVDFLIRWASSAVPRALSPAGSPVASRRSGCRPSRSGSPGRSASAWRWP